MLAIRKDKTGPGITLCEIPKPKIKDDEVLVKILATALCKSDLDVIYDAESFRLSKVPLPFTLGHEFCGEIVEAGADVSQFKIGDKICGETHVPCGQCRTCGEGKPHICPEMGLIGRTVNGCFAEYMAVPEKAAVRVPGSMAPAHAALLEPLGVAVHSLQEAGIEGKSLLITGTGTIGTMVLECAKALGAKQIIVTSRKTLNLERAKAIGADAVINTETSPIHEKIKEYTDGAGVDCVIEMTGKNHILNQAIDCLRAGGKIICVGNQNEPVTIDDFTRRVMYREIIITGIFGRRLFDTWDLAIQLAESKRINLERYVGKFSRLEFLEKEAENFENYTGRIIFMP